jgi:hypothetical protein
MTEPSVIGALRDKQCELSASIAHLEQLVAEHRADMAHLERVLRLFDPSIGLEEVRPERQSTQRTWFRPGESRRLIYDVLRDARQPMATHDITDRVIAAKGIVLMDDRSRGLIQKTILASLHRAKEMIERVTIEGVVGWRVIQAARARCQ